MDRESSQVAGTSTSPAPRPSRPRIHAVVTVHGMGDPRPNSTLAPVAERFAWSCGIEPSRSRGETLSLGMLTGRTGTWEPGDSGFAPALQLKGVRLKPYGPGEKPPIFPIPGLWNDHDLYFADLFWSPITDKAFEQSGEALDHWTQGLINRLYRKQLHEQEKAGRENAGEEEKNYWWVVDSLTLLRKTLVVAEKLASLRFKKITDLIFGKYLGDVQLYGESPTIRGKAVKVFHETMAGLHAQLLSRHPDAQIEYTLLAHSLGTVLTFDSLLSAMAKPVLLAQPASGDPGQLPFPGYHAKGQSLPDLRWSRHVRALVTLGSPIDKFLALWWHNYDYLTCPEAWMRDDLPPIKHYNFCDEQDPVGHNLDLARTAPAYRRLFAEDKDGNNDLLYNHTPYAGYAHIDYWKDQSLFDLIHRRVVAPDSSTGPEDITGEDKKRFPMTSNDVTKRIKRLHFLVLPVILTLATHFILLGTLLAKSWHSAALWTAGLIAAFWFSRQILGLNLAWRQILKQKRKLTPLGKKRDESYPESSQIHWRIAAIIAWMISFVTMPILVRQRGEWNELQAGIIGFTVVMALMVMVAIWKFFPARQTKISSRPPDLLAANAPEWVMVSLAFFPTFLALGSLFWKEIGFIPKVEGWHFGLLLFIAPLAQIATWVWMEMWILHSQVKHRFNQGQLLKDSKFAGLEIKAMVLDLPKAIPGMADASPKSAPGSGLGFAAYAKDD